MDPASQFVMTDISQPSLQRHDSFYLFDGSICLLARGIVFRVFKSLLAEESGVFKDMFTVGSDGQAEGQSLYDGVPLISLDDDPEDLANLFRFLWKPPHAEPEFDTLYSCIHISTKYVMDLRLTSLLERLQAMVPWEYKDFQTCQAYYQKHPDHAAKVIALAGKCHLPLYLPPAFYFLACEESGRALSVRGPYALDAEDIRRIHFGKTAIQNRWWDFVRESDDIGLKSSAAPCYGWNDASSYRLDARISALQAGAQDPMKHWVSGKSISGHGCSGCMATKFALAGDFAKHLFDDLPVIFDL
ncbi:hypothetical protein FRC05_001197 [Tulasnella sp. 425]|nr:hypothetical protein FRC05_001197 [Tulasnella sp. 425]